MIKVIHFELKNLGDLSIGVPHENWILKSQDGDCFEFESDEEYCHFLNHLLSAFEYLTGEKVDITAVGLQDDDWGITDNVEEFEEKFKIGTKYL